MTIDVDTEESVSTKPSLAELVEEHFDYLYRYAFRYVRMADSAEDVVQETFLAAAEGLDRFGGRSSPRTWLVGILRHKLLDLIRKRLRDREDLVASDDMGEYFDGADHWRAESGPLGWGTPPEQVLRQREFISAVERCLDRVPERMRQIFLLREMEGYEREEIGTQLDLTSNHIGVLLHRARILLQQCLQRTWFKQSGERGRP